MQSSIEKVLTIFLSCYQVSIVISICSTPVNLINHLSTFCETQDSWNSSPILIDDEAHDFCDATEHVSWPKHVSLSNQVTLLGGQVTPWW